MFVVPSKNYQTNRKDRVSEYNGGKIEYIGQETLATDRLRESGGIGRVVKDTHIKFLLLFLTPEIYIYQLLLHSVHKIGLGYALFSAQNAPGSRTTRDSRGRCSNLIIIIRLMPLIIWKRMLERCHRDGYELLAFLFITNESIVSLSISYQDETRIMVFYFFFYSFLYMAADPNCGAKNSKMITKNRVHGPIEIIKRRKKKVL